MFEDHFFLEIACRMNVRIKFEGRKGPRLQTVEENGLIFASKLINKVI